MHSDESAEINLLSSRSNEIIFIVTLFHREIKSMSIDSFHKHKYTLIKRELELHILGYFQRVILTRGLSHNQKLTHKYLVTFSLVAWKYAAS